MKRVCLPAVLFLVVFASSARAAPVNCLSVLGANVLTLTNGCVLQSLTFDQFQVSGVPNPPGSSVFLSAIGTGISGGWENLGFQISTPNPPSDTILEYRVTGSIEGVDNFHNGIDTRIQEIVCAAAFVNGVCAPQNVLANFANAGGTSIAWFAPQTQVWIQKDILLNQSTSFISSFSNSHHLPVPEPVSAVLLGTGLLGLAARRWRRRS